LIQVTNRRWQERLVNLLTPFISNMRCIQKESLDLPTSLYKKVLK
jgi:hypothetical protein